MKPTGAALLVFPREDLLQVLENALYYLGVQTQHAHNCAEARAVLSGGPLPSVVFTQSYLADGTWADVLSLAKTSQRAIPVVLVSRLVDTRLYLEALESGVCDFIVPPFYSSDLTHVIRTAVLNSQDDDPQAATRSASV